MRSSKKTFLFGTVAADPEVRQTLKGITVATFPVASHRDLTSNNEVTDFHRVVAWGKLGEIFGRYLKKGKAVHVEGMIIKRAYEVDGERYLTEIRAGEVHTLSYKKNKDKEQTMISRRCPCRS